MDFGGLIVWYIAVAWVWMLVFVIYCGFCGVVASVWFGVCGQRLLVTGLLIIVCYLVYDFLVVFVCG